MGEGFFYKYIEHSEKQLAKVYFEQCLSSIFVKSKVLRYVVFPPSSLHKEMPLIHT